MTKLKNPGGLLLFSLFIGWLAQLLFVNQRPGISVLIFVVVFGSGFWVISQLEGQKIKLENLWLLIPLIFCATMVMIRANLFVSFLNLLIVGFCITLLAVFMTTGKSYNLGVLGFATLPIRAVGSMALRPAPILRDNVDFEAMHVASRETVYPVLRGTLLAFPVLIVFAGLLISADAVFAKTVSSLFDIDIDWGIRAFLWRGFIILFVGWTAAGYSAYALRSSVKVARPIPERILGRISKSLPLGIIESTTILGLVNMLFGVFVAIQFAYLFGGQQFIQLDGISYAEYARRGFFEMVVVAVLTLLLVQLLNWFTLKKYGGDKRRFNILASFSIGFVLVMLVSAFQRLALYEWTYGFTQLRIFVHTFMVWMSLVLCWYILTLWFRPNRFAAGALICIFGFVVSLNIINPDALIVQKNLQRYQTIGHLDLDYLTNLSADAVPSLIELDGIIANDEAISNGKTCNGHDWVSRSSSSSRVSSGYDERETCIESAHPEVLRDELNARYKSYSQSDEWTSWPSFHVAHLRAAQTLGSWAE
ncbi:MAG: DUF4173 domain-containing protein [Chloroflexota bacterium]